MHSPSRMAVSYQPAKTAAIEGLWETGKGGTALNLVGLPDMEAEETRDALQVPHLGSLILKVPLLVHDAGRVQPQDCRSRSA
jgi:cytochrome bd-type quinol oxidase subunit 1